ncbi:SirB2 family protein [Alcaligenaceae bacterium]|nr:SirB2 family protein [Alcaligenaceae bacterium]
MPYFAIKHLHITAAALSIIFFIIRAYWSVNGSDLLQRRVVKILPHVIDTVLLVCGVILASMIGPNQPWILAKVVALIAYIGVGTIAIKRGKTPKTRGVAAIIAVAIFFYIVGVALAHSPLSWLATKPL